MAASLAPVSQQNSRTFLTPESNRSWWKCLGSRQDKKLTFAFVSLILLCACSVISVAILALRVYRSSTTVCMTRDCITAAAVFIKSLDEKTDPCNDFYQFSCGGWMTENQIPDDSTSYGTFSHIQDQLLPQLRDILAGDGGDSTALTKMVDFYSSCMNESQIELRSLSPLIEELNSMGGWPMAWPKWSNETYDWLNVTAHLRRRSVSTVFTSTVGIDLKNSSRHVFIFDQPPLGISRIYLLRSILYRKQIRAYRKLMIQVATLVRAEMGYNTSETDELSLEQQVDDVIKFETRLAAASMGDRNIDLHLIYHNMTLEELTNITQQKVDFARYISIASNWTLNLNESQEVVVYDVMFYKWLPKLIEDVSARTLSNYQLWTMISSLAWNLNKKMRQAVFDYNKDVNGVDVHQPRWKVCTALVNRLLGYAVGYQYVKNHFDADSKAEMNELVLQLRKSFKQMLEESMWMDNTTIHRAIDKADGMRQFIAYPDWITNTTVIDVLYENHTIDKDMYFENIIDTLMVESLKSFMKFDRKVQKNRWVSPPTVINAFYSYDNNAISFPAAILQPPFFTHGSLRAMNYGAIGAIIGHEITHGFDDVGRQNDKDGNLVQWWEDSAIRKYKQHAQCLIDQYTGYCPEELPGTCVNGNTTLGENIADNGGLKEALMAYQHWSRHHDEEPSLPGLERFSSLQIFFLSFAKIWCHKSRLEALHQRILHDPHSPWKYRVWGVVSNMAEFSDAFKCPLNSPMNPEKKCRLW